MKFNVIPQNGFKNEYYGNLAVSNTTKISTERLYAKLIRIAFRFKCGTLSTGLYLSTGLR